MSLADTAIGLDASYVALPPRVADIRRAVARVARRGGADSEMLTRIELAVSEAATNVVLHAYRAPATAGPIHVTAMLGGGVLDVCVRDSGGGMAPRNDSPGMGLGLSVMAHEADHFEISTPDGGGTAVLLRFELGAG